MSTPETAMSLSGLPLRLVGSGVFFEDEVQAIQRSVDGKKKTFFAAAIEKKPASNIDICLSAAEAGS